MRLPTVVAREIVERVLTGKDYRPVIVQLIDTEFLNYTVKFFKRVVDAKIEGEKITDDWYRKCMLSPQLPKEEIARNAGLNMKTIQNAHSTTRKQVVLDEAHRHYERLKQIVDELIQGESCFGVEMTLSFRNVSVSLDVVESLIVINALAVARAAIRGGAWSTAGKQVEAPLMETLCALHQVPKRHYDQSQVPASERETDFFLIGDNGEHYRCEVKLLGRGNPESADAPLARSAKVFVADTISNTMKQQLSNAGILWVELRGAQDWTQFAAVLDKLGIPRQPVPIDEKEHWLEKSLNAVFSARTPMPKGVQEGAAQYSAGIEQMVELE